MKNDKSIVVEGVSKSYQLGSQGESYETFRDAMVSLLKAPFRRFAALRGGGGAGDENLFWALKDVGFEIPEGEIVGIIGPNGAGKSTLLKVLSKITEPTVGRATIRGRVGSLLEVGTGFHPELSGRENIYLNGAILGMGRAEIKRKFDEIVEFAEVERFLDTPVKRYSSGMYVRLAFAVAAHLEPEVLIVDEVLAVGDAAFQRKCLGRMSEVSKTGRTVLFVSHNMSAIQSLTNSCVLMSGGRSVMHDETKKVVTEYLNLFRSSSGEDFSEAARYSFELGQKIRIMKIRAKTPIEYGYYFNDDLVFEIELDSKVKKEGLRFGVTIADAGGQGILTTSTACDIDVEEGERAVFEIRLSDTNIVPGNYVMSVSVGEGNLSEARVQYDVVNPGPMFCVCDFDRSGEVLYNWNPAYGCIAHGGAAFNRVA